MKLFNPVLLFGGIWLLQILGHLFFTNIFYPISQTTWAIVITSAASFLVGALLPKAHHPKTTGNTVEPKNDEFSQWVSKQYKWFFYGYTALAAISFIAIYTLLTNKGFEINSYELLRIAIVSDFTGDRGVSAFLKIFFLGVGVSLFFLCHSHYLKKNQIFSIVAIGIISSILTTGRLALLLMFSGSTYILYSLNKFKIRGLAGFGLAFVILFFAMAILANKGSDTAGLYQQISWNFQVYMFGGLPNFDHFVVFGNPKIQGGALLPNTIRPILSHAFGTTLLKPAVNQFVAYPIESNTFTFIYPLYHDLGIFGTSIICAILGATHKLLYIWQFKKNTILRYIYAISIYPLFMTIFEDAYFSSPGFWAILLAIPLFFKTIFQIKKRLKKSVAH